MRAQARYSISGAEGIITYDDDGVIIKSLKGAIPQGLQGAALVPVRGSIVEVFDLSIPGKARGPWVRVDAMARALEVKPLELLPRKMRKGTATAAISAKGLGALIHYAWQTTGRITVMTLSLADQRIRALKLPDAKKVAFDLWCYDTTTLDLRLDTVKLVGAPGAGVLVGQEVDEEQEEEQASGDDVQPCSVCSELVEHIGCEPAEMVARVKQWGDVVDSWDRLTQVMGVAWDTTPDEMVRQVNNLKVNLSAALDAHRGQRDRIAELEHDRDQLARDIGVRQGDIGSTVEKMQIIINAACAATGSSPGDLSESISALKMRAEAQHVRASFLDQHMDKACLVAGCSGENLHSTIQSLKARVAAAEMRPTHDDTRRALERMRQAEQRSSQLAERGRKAEAEADRYNAELKRAQARITEMRSEWRERVDALEAELEARYTVLANTERERDEMRAHLISARTAVEGKALELARHKRTIVALAGVIAEQRQA
jgi:hypothetical protein